MLKQYFKAISDAPDWKVRALAIGLGVLFLILPGIFFIGALYLAMREIDG